MKPRRHLSTLLAALFLFSSVNLSAQSGVFLRSSDAPKPSKTPKGIDLRDAPGSESALKVRAALAEIRLDSDSSRGAAGMTGRLNVFRKFIRVDIYGATRLSQPATVKVKYIVKEGDATTPKEDTVNIAQAEANFTVDTEGFEDTFGTEVKSTSSFYSSTSTKYKHFESEIVSVQITIIDKSGHELYVGSWPDPATTPAKLPPHLKLRTYTSTDGKKLQATIAAVSGDIVTLMIRGKAFDVPISKLSEADQKFINEVPKQAE